MFCSGHLVGVQPLGAGLCAGRLNIRGPGLGALAMLPDEIIVEIFGLLAPKDLIRLSSSSKALYCFSNHEDLWKALTIQEFEGRFQFQATWKDTYVHMTQQPAPRERRMKRADGQPTGIRQERRLNVNNFYSDVLYQGHLCAMHPIPPRWLSGNLPRRHGLTPVQFRRDFEEANEPVVLVDDPSVRYACKHWTKEYIFSKLQGKSAIAGDMEMLADDFFAYMEHTHDDMPLYLFDKRFAERCPDLAREYSVPAVFPEDLFSVLGPGRPDFRWLIVGPARSGSSFHVDPNSTSAWNAAICGRKLWVMFPPNCTPPGVYASADGTNVAAPVSVVEWFINFFDACGDADTRCLHGVVHPGELIFVPHGWWHCVLNLDFSIAITQNFVSAVNLPSVLRLLRTRSRKLLSGCHEEERELLYERFISALRREQPQLVAEWGLQQAHEAEARASAHRLAGLLSHDKGQMGKQVPENLAGSDSDPSTPAVPEKAHAASPTSFKFAFSL